MTTLTRDEVTKATLLPPGRAAREQKHHCCIKAQRPSGCWHIVPIASTVGLTDAGQAVHRKVVPKVLSVERRLLSELDRKERALIIRIIRELENRLATV